MFFAGRIETNELQGNANLFGSGGFDTPLRSYSTTEYF